MLVDELYINFINQIVEFSDKNVYIEKTKDGSITDSILFSGIVFKKFFSYAGYQQEPKKKQMRRFFLTSVDLEWKSERDNAELRINAVEQYDEFVNVEWKIITDKLDSIVRSGASLVFSTAPIGDYATQYFARNNMCCAGRVDEKDIQRVSDRCKATVLSSPDNIQENKLGTCILFEERFWAMKDIILYRQKGQLLCF